MPDLYWGLRTDYGTEDLPSADLNNVNAAAIAVYRAVAELLGVAGIRAPGDWNASLVVGALEVDMSVGVGLLGPVDGLKEVSTGEIIRVDGLAASASGGSVNRIWKTREMDGEDRFMVTQSGSAPVTGAHLCATVVTDSDEGTSADNNPTGRVNLGSVLFTRVAATIYAHLTLDNAVNLILGTGTGSKIGTAAAQKLGLWGAAPIVQPSGAAQAAVVLGNTDNEIGGLTISAAYSQAEVQALRDKCEELADDVRNLSALVHAMRTAMVNTGSMKGSA